MARGSGSAPGAYADLVEAFACEIARARMLVLDTGKNGLIRAAIAERKERTFGLTVTLAHNYSADSRVAFVSNSRDSPHIVPGHGASGCGKGPVQKTGTLRNLDDHVSMALHVE